MNIKKPRINNIADYLQDSESPLGRVIQKAHQINQVQNHLILILGPEFKEHLWVGNYQNGLLSLLVDSASLATKLRFCIPDLREKLRKQNAWSGLKSIEIKMMVTLPSQTIQSP